MYRAIRVKEYCDVAWVYYVRLCETANEFGKGVGAHEIDEYDGPEAIYILVADEDGKPVSTCRLNYLDETTGKIERVSTVKEHRGKGAGSAAIRAAEEWMKENGVEKIVINSRESAVGFYEKLGYVTDWDTYNHREGSPFSTVYTYKTL